MLTESMKVAEDNLNSRSLYHGLPCVSTRIGVDSMLYADKPVKSSKEAIWLLAEHLYNNTRETCYILCMDHSEMPLCVAEVGLGNEQGSFVSARDVVQIGLLCNASYLMLIHNHPTLIPDKRHLAASSDDIQLTDAISRALSLQGMMLVDSIIVSAYRENGYSRVPAYYSMKEHNYKRMVKKEGLTYYEIPETESQIAWGISGNDALGVKIDKMGESCIEQYEIHDHQIKDRIQIAVEELSK